MSTESLSSEARPGRGRTLILLLVAGLVLIATLFVVGQRREPPASGGGPPATARPSQPADHSEAEASDCEDEEPPAESFALASCDGDSSTDETETPDRPDE